MPESINSPEQTSSPEERSDSARSATAISLTILASLVGVGFFVGGPILGLVVFGTLLVANHISRTLGTLFAISVATIVNLVFLGLTFMALVPLLRGFTATRTLLFDESNIVPFVARDTLLENLTELSRTGAIVLVLVPLIMFISYTLFRQGHRLKLQLRPSLTIVAFLPLLVGALNKFRDPLAYIVSTTSGDGRNNFLHVQRIRVLSDFTSFRNIRSQGDFSSSIASLISDGLGSTGLLQFNDQYAIAAAYLFFGVIISASSLAVVQHLQDQPIENVHLRFRAVALAPLIIVSLFSVRMPWIMNEMFRSGFYSTVAVMALCAALVAVCTSKVKYRLRLYLLIVLSALAFATYQVAAIFPLLALVLTSASAVAGLARLHPYRVATGAGLLALLFIRLLPGVMDQMKGRLLLEGSITYLNDDYWPLLTIASLAMMLSVGKIRRVSLVVFIASSSTWGFQYLAENLRQSSGQPGYGYYGAKFAYIGLFILLIVILASLAASVLKALVGHPWEKSPGNLKKSATGVGLAVGLLLFSHGVSGLILPESRSFYGDSRNWVAPTAQGLQLAVAKWDLPQVIFLRVADPGSDRLTNFWHPFYWNGDAWNWIYGGFSDEVSNVCNFIGNRDIPIVTRDLEYGKMISQACSVKVISP